MDESISKFPSLSVSLALLLLGFLTGMEFVWIGFVLFWMIVWTVRLWPRAMCALPFPLGVAIIGAHLSGYKLFGSPTLRDNRPLIEHPMILDHLVLPNILVATDGSRHTLQGMRFMPEIDQLTSKEQRQMIDRLGEPLRFEKNENMSSGYSGEFRIHYFCGNTWFPTILPQRLPTHSREDLALIFSHLSVKDHKVAQTAP